MASYPRFSFVFIKFIYNACTISIECALLSLENPYPKNETIQAIQENVSHSTKKKKKFEFLWVPSHTGIIGNELAANEAKQHQAW